MPTDRPAGTNIDVTAEVESWWSENPERASVSSSGVVQGIAPGWAAIHASYRGLHTWWNLRIVYPPLGSTPRPAEVKGRLQEITASDTISVGDAQVEVAGGALNGTMVTSGSDGAFRIDGFTATDFDLVVRRTGYQTLRYHPTSLGVDLGTLQMTPEPSLMSDAFQGEICSPKRTVTTTFTPTVSGIFRVTSTRSASLALYVGDVAVPVGLSNDTQLHGWRRV